MPTQASAVQKLDPSRLANSSQMHLLGGDLDIDSFHLQMRQGVGIDIVSAIIDSTIDRTIDGASTVTVMVDDDNNRKIQTSGDLGKRVDVNLDGLWWTLAGVKKTGRQLGLTFEEREVNLLRKYDDPMFANRDKVNRAQFVLRMIKEVRETHIKWVIPELNLKQTISDLGPNQVLVDGNGNPLPGAANTSDIITAASERQKGIRTNARLTVRGATATPEQIKNADAVLSTGEGMKANNKVLLSSIMVAIDESNILNLPGGDRDSRGVFQQRPSQGWPASGNVATDAAAYFKEAIRADQQNPHLSIQMLCQTVQRSGTSDGSNYAAFYDEANSFVNEYDRNPTASEQGLLTTAGSISANTNLFMRGQITKARGMNGAYLLTRENSWNCMQRLAQEVNWRAFCVSGTIYFISEQWLLKSKPFMTISEGDPGIDWIDYDYDEGKPRGTCTVTAHLSRWAAPPGSTVQIVEHGPVDGKWIVQEVSRSIYNNIATITLEKPLPMLPEPVALSGIPSGFGGTPKTGGNSGGNTNASLSLAAGNEVQKQVVLYAQSQLGVPYAWGGEKAGVGFDCSGLAQAAYSSADPKLPLPRVAQDQYNFGRKLSKAEILEPGDLVFFGSDTQHIGHVGIYVGGGNMIDAPHSGANVRTENIHTWAAPEAFVGATRPWQR